VIGQNMTTEMLDLDTYYTGRKTVAALFQNRQDAETAINALKANGFRGDQIGIAMRDRTAQGELIEETGSKAAEGAVTGAVGGGLLGGIAGFLIGIGALAIPGIGPVVSAGVLTATLGTVGATAAVGAGVGAAAGGIVGALVGLGIPEEEARYLETGFREGRTLVTVNTNNRVMEAVRILEQYGGDLGVNSRRMPTTSGAMYKTVR
jgi:Heat induced stress protein YflT domain